MISIIMDWFSKIGNGQVVEILFPEKIDPRFIKITKFLKIW